MSIEFYPAIIIRNKFLISLIILIVFNINCVLSMPKMQSDKIDSLLNKLDKKTDTSKINILNKLSGELYFINTDSALMYAKDALQLSESIAYINGIAESNRNIGRG